MATQISLNTLVSFVMKLRRTRAVPSLSLLGEQEADVSRELLLALSNAQPRKSYRHSHNIHEVDILCEEQSDLSYA